MMRDITFDLIRKEERRQAETLALIPSENYASKAVREAVGSVMMNKYAEGQVGRRYYQGNQVVDEVEGLCKRRALDLFGLDEQEWGVNVQAHSGSPANLAVYNALLEPGEKIWSMFLPDGGHLSHGWKIATKNKKQKTKNNESESDVKKITLVSKVWEVEFYKTDPVRRVFDYGKLAREVKKVKPKLVVSGGTAYPREIDHERMGEIAKSVGAYYLADVSHEAGLVAAGVNRSPFEWADVVMMTTHKTLRGPRGAIIFSRRKSEIRNPRKAPSRGKPKLETNSKSQIQNTKDETVDLSKLVDASVFPGLQGGPHLHSIAGIAVCLGEAMGDEFEDYAKQVVRNAQVLAGVLVEGGLDVVSGGTDKHLVLVDLRSVSVSGWVVAWALEVASIVANRNTVPGERASPYYPSGLRLGTPATTTRGMGEKEMRQIGRWVVEISKYCQKWSLPLDKEERGEFVAEFMEEVWGDGYLREVGEGVQKLCRKFPMEDLF